MDAPTARTPRPDFWTSDEWSTPPEIIEELAAEFGPFDLDVCARPETAQAPIYFTKDHDGLQQSWFGRVWMNPPYSNPAPWLKKAIEETQSGNCDLVVALLPAATDTRWFHDFVFGRAAEVRFRKGRIKFLGWEGASVGSPKSGSVFAVYRRSER